MATLVEVALTAKPNAGRKRRAEIRW